MLLWQAWRALQANKRRQSKRSGLLITKIITKKESNGEYYTGNYKLIVSVKQGSKPQILILQVDFVLKFNKVARIRHARIIVYVFSEFSLWKQSD